MNLLHVIQRYYPYIGGSEQYIQELSERLVRDGQRVTVYTTDAWDLEHFWRKGKRTISARRAIHNGVHIERFPVEHLPLSSLTYPALRRLMTLIAKLPLDTTAPLFALARFTPYVPALERALATNQEAFDLVHAVNISLDSTVLAAYRFARRWQIPFVVTPFTHFGEPDNTQVRRFYTMLHQLEMLSHADAVIAMTELERTALHTALTNRSNASSRSTHSNIFRIPVGVDPRSLNGGDGARLRAKHNINNPIIAFIGTSAYDKGTMHLVAAMQKVWQTHDATLVIAGPQLSAFERYFAAQPISVKQRTRVLGFISDEEKRDLLAASDLFAMPSRTDTFGIVFLEAWVYSKPVIGALAGGLPEVIADGQNGFLVKFGDTDALAARIIQLLDDKPLARRLGECGKARVLSEWTWDRTYAGVKDIYEGLMVKD